MGRKEIHLEFDKTLSNLTGNSYGRRVFNEQIGESFVPGEKITIIFPDNIKNIGSSFIQGFFEKIAESVGISGIEEYVELHAKSIENAQEYIIKKLVV